MFDFLALLSNPIVISVALMLGLCFSRINVVMSLTTASIVCGLLSGYSLDETVKVFVEGLGDGANLTLTYAILGAFAAALANSGLPEVALDRAVNFLKFHFKYPDEASGDAPTSSHMGMKCVLFLMVVVAAYASKTIIPVHVAFIPLLIPQLLPIFNQLQVDRRMISCLLTYGLILAYLLFPIGFGDLFMHEILYKNLALNNSGLSLTGTFHAMWVPIIGMTIGALLSLIYFRKNRVYVQQDIKTAVHKHRPRSKDLLVSVLSVIVALVVQLMCHKNTMLGALVGFLVLILGGTLKRQDSDHVAATGFKMMAMIGITMLVAHGFGKMITESGQSDAIIHWLAAHAENGRAMASFEMILIGALIAIGIGSSFSTVPIVASVYVPLGIRLGFSPSAIAIIIATAGICGDAGSPASSSNLGPMMGLDVDHQHNLIKDTVMPSFFFLTIPVFLTGWIASLIL